MPGGAGEPIFVSIRLLIWEARGGPSNWQTCSGQSGQGTDHPALIVVFSKDVHLLLYWTVLWSQSSEQRRKPPH